MRKNVCPAVVAVVYPAPPSVSRPAEPDVPSPPVPPSSVAAAVVGMLPLLVLTASHTCEFILNLRNLKWIQVIFPGDSIIGMNDPVKTDIDYNWTLSTDFYFLMKHDVRYAMFLRENSSP